VNDALAVLALGYVSAQVQHFQWFVECLFVIGPCDRVVVPKGEALEGAYGSNECEAEPAPIRESLNAFECWLASLEADKVVASRTFDLHWHPPRDWIRSV
jgi:hypothetical protein